MVPNPRADGVKVRDADRVLRCWKCKAERVLSAHDYARKKDTRTPLTTGFDPCDCGGFFALHRLASRAENSHE